MTTVTDNEDLRVSMIVLPIVAMYIFPFLHYTIMKRYYYYRHSHSAKPPSDNRYVREMDSHGQIDQTSDNTDEEALENGISIVRIYSVHCNVWVWLWILYFATTAGAEENEYPGTREIGDIYGYVHIPLLSLYMYVETLFSVEWKYLSNTLDEKTFKEYIKDLTEIRPIIRVKVTCSHALLWNRSPRLDVKDISLIKIIDNEEYKQFSYYRFEDLTISQKILSSMESSKMTKIILSKTVLFGDEHVKGRFDEFLRDSEILTHGKRFGPNSKKELAREDEIPGLKERLLVFSGHGHWWAKKYVFSIFSCLLVTWPYRIVFSIVSQKGHLRIVKKVYSRGDHALA